ncbi:DUF167 domain-containing protein [Patescibacteria group bacterium]|nr:DUF167 domain-containing protein [Patescibacteria group bacterium]
MFKKIRLVIKLIYKKTDCNVSIAKRYKFRRKWVNLSAMPTLNQLFEEFEKSGRIVLRVKVIPRSVENAIVGFLDEETLKIRVAAVPEKGKANKELIAFLAAEFKVPRENIEIISGAGDPLKLIRIEK